MGRDFHLLRWSELAWLRPGVRPGKQLQAFKERGRNLCMGDIMSIDSIRYARAESSGGKCFHCHAKPSHDPYVHMDYRTYKSSEIPISYAKHHTVGDGDKLQRLNKTITNTQNHKHQSALSLPDYPPSWQDFTSRN